MLGRVKYKSLKNLIEQKLKERDVSVQNSSLKKIGFLIDENFFNDFDALIDFSKNLGLKSQDVHIFSFRKTNKKLSDLRIDQVTNKEFTLRGELTNQNATEFLDIPFEVLIGFYQERNIFLDFMVASSKAEFKIGFQDRDARLYDLILKIDLEDLELFKTEVTKYLGVFKKL